MGSAERLAAAFRIVPPVAPCSVCGSLFATNPDQERNCSPACAHEAAWRKLTSPSAYRGKIHSAERMSESSTDGHLTSNEYSEEEDDQDQPTTPPPSNHQELPLLPKDKPLPPIIPEQLGLLPLLGSDVSSFLQCTGLFSADDNIETPSTPPQCASTGNRRPRAPPLELSLPSSIKRAAFSDDIPPPVPPRPKGGHRPPHSARTFAHVSEKCVSTGNPRPPTPPLKVSLTSPASHAAFLDDIPPPVPPRPKGGHRPPRSARTSAPVLEKDLSAQIARFAPRRAATCHEGGPGDPPRTYIPPATNPPNPPIHRTPPRGTIDAVFGFPLPAEPVEPSQQCSGSAPSSLSKRPVARRVAFREDSSSFDLPLRHNMPRHTPMRSNTVPLRSAMRKNIEYQEVKSRPASGPMVAQPAQEWFPRNQRSLSRKTARIPERTMHGTTQHIAQVDPPTDPLLPGKLPYSTVNYGMLRQRGPPPVLWRRPPSPKLPPSNVPESACSSRSPSPVPPERSVVAHSHRGASTSTPEPELSSTMDVPLFFDGDELFNTSDMIESPIDQTRREQNALSSSSELGLQVDLRCLSGRPNTDHPIIEDPPPQTLSPPERHSGKDRLSGRWVSAERQHTPPFLRRSVDMRGARTSDSRNSLSPEGAIWHIVNFLRRSVGDDDDEEFGRPRFSIYSEA